MKDAKAWIWLVGLVCGVELLVISIVGGAGLGAFFGLNGVLVAAIGAAGVFVASRRLIAKRSGREVRS